MTTGDLQWAEVQGRVLTVIAIVGAAGVGCNLGARSYELCGQVLGVDAERQEVLLKHEDMPGRMSMLSRAREGRFLDGFRAGAGS